MKPFQLSNRQPFVNNCRPQKRQIYQADMYRKKKQTQRMAGAKLSMFDKLSVTWLRGNLQGRWRSCFWCRDQISCDGLDRLQNVIQTSSKSSPPASKRNCSKKSRSSGLHFRAPTDTLPMTMKSFLLPCLKKPMMQLFLSIATRSNTLQRDQVKRFTAKLSKLATRGSDVSNGGGSTD